MSTRRPAVAGLFYPSDPASLRDRVERLLADAAPDAVPDGAPKALIVPHAGYDYSGPVAASAYARLRPARERISRVVLLGPAHRVPVAGLAASTATEFATPLGPAPVDVPQVQTAARLPQVEFVDEAHAPEHSLEVQLPFLQVVLDEFQIVPFVVGQAGGAEVAEVLETLWGGPETLIIVSSDLSHFHDHETAAKIDHDTAALIEALQADDLTGRRACGYLPIRGLLEEARTRGLTVRNVDLRDSSQTAGDPARVVGYGAFVAS